MRDVAMNRLFSAALAFFIASITQVNAGTSREEMERSRSAVENVKAGLQKVDVVWRTPSANSAGSMPIGNGETVVNAWVEEGTGDILLLIGRTDSLSEISRILKIGRLRVQISPNPFLGKDFSHRLNLHDGVIELQGSGEKIGLFVDSGADAIHLNGRWKTPRKSKVVVESWRESDRTLPANEMKSAWTAQNAPFPLVESADQFLDLRKEDRLGWYHSNRSSIVPQILTLQSLTGLKGTFDPLEGRTFGAIVEGRGLKAVSPRVLEGSSASRDLEIVAVTYRNQDRSKWMVEAKSVARRSPSRLAMNRTKEWWNGFWNRSHVFVEEPVLAMPVPKNSFPLRQGVDSGGGNRFQGKIDGWMYWDRVLAPSQFETASDGFSVPGSSFDPPSGFTLRATITPDQLVPGRIFDKLTAGRDDGFLFDTYPGNGLRLIVGDMTLTAPGVLKQGVAQRVCATFDAKTGEAAIYLDDKRVAHRQPPQGSVITRGYVLQRYVQACQARGEYPVKFNGGYFTVEPTPMGIDSNPDYRNWGDAFWFQNVRHIYHPMLASGDVDMMDPFFRLYEKARPLAESRSGLYHGVKGAYFPETMTPFGTYAGGDYGWNREGLQPKDVQCPWWDDAWNQGPELVALMLDRWDYTRDAKFLKERVLPMAESILLYFDTRFKKDANGKMVIDPTQVVETYWEGVINDAPSVAGLIAVTNRICALPEALLSAKQRAFFNRMRSACPDLPIEIRDGAHQLAPAQAYKPVISNVENGELYGVWPFGLVSLANPKLLPEAKRAYANRKNRLDTGWGYDGNVAAMLGMTDEAARILNVKVRNSHPAFRWPATWGPNFDWLPDQNHGGNLLNTTHLMLLQSDPLESGGKIRVLPAWPRGWNVEFKLHAVGNTVVECTFRSGKIERLFVSPAARRKDVVLPEGLLAPK